MTLCGMSLTCLSPTFPPNLFDQSNQWCRPLSDKSLKALNSEAERLKNLARSTSSLFDVPLECKTFNIKIVCKQIDLLVQIVPIFC